MAFGADILDFTWAKSAEMLNEVRSVRKYLRGERGGQTDEMGEQVKMEVMIEAYLKDR